MRCGQIPHSVNILVYTTSTRLHPEPVHSIYTCFLFKYTLYPHYLKENNTISGHVQSDPTPLLLPIATSLLAPGRNCHWLSVIVLVFSLSSVTCWFVCLFAGLFVVLFPLC